MSRMKQLTAQPVVQAIWTAIWPNAKRFGHRRDGGAFIEAALVIPLGLLLFVGISEFAQGFTINRRLEAAAGTAADLVTRHQVINTADLVGIKTMLDEMVKPYPVNTFNLRITSIQTDETETATVVWSFVQGSDVSAHTSGATITIPPGLAGPNSGIVLAEVSYAFTSSLSLLIPAGIPMRAESYFPPRIGGLVELAD